MRTTILMCLATGSFLVALPTAQAADLTFNGSVSGTGMASLDPSCAPAPARGILAPATSSGTSTIGNFTYGHNWCFYGANGPINGTFNISFGADTLLGSVTGLASPSATAGVANLNLSYAILGGTGAYTGATGAFSGLATADTRSGQGSLFNLNFTGLISPVPEPSSWALMLLGFGIVGWRMRRADKRVPCFSRAHCGATV
jgi:hypothetical protein